MSPLLQMPYIKIIGQCKYWSDLSVTKYYKASYIGNKMLT